ncbi:cysteine protease, partial [Escherichia coli]|nr:cysteine protease [Escherichia coli]
LDNHFVTGRSGATIYPGQGSNIITIPKNINDFFITDIFLDADSLIQYVQLEHPVSDIKAFIRKSNKIVLSLRGNHSGSVKRIEFQGNNGGNINDFLGRIVMYTLDGIELELSANKESPVVAAKIDIPKFEKYHGDIGILDPFNILENNNLYFVKENISEFDFGNYRVVSSQDTFIYK